MLEALLPRLVDAVCRPKLSVRLEIVARIQKQRMHFKAEA